MKHPTNVIEFWVVWCPEKESPKKRHNSADYALVEAKRLADLNPGYSFYVLKSTSVARGVEERKTTVTVETTRSATPEKPPSADILWEAAYPRTALQIELYPRAGFSRPASLDSKVRVLFKDRSTFTMCARHVVWINAAWWGYVA